MLSAQLLCRHVVWDIEFSMGQGVLGENSEAPWDTVETQVQVMYAGAVNVRKWPYITVHYI